MCVATNIVFETHIIPLAVDKTCLPVSRVVLGVMNRDDDLELCRTGLTNPFDGAHLIGMRTAGRIDKRLVVETRGFDDECIALEMTHRVTVVVRQRNQFLLGWHRFVYPDHTNLMI